MRTTITLQNGHTLKVGDECRFLTSSIDMEDRWRRGRVHQILQGTGVERAIVTWNRDGSRHLVSRYNLRALAMALFLLALAACSGDDEPYIDLDARGCCLCAGPDCPDGGTEDDAADAVDAVPDASPELPEGAVCNVLAQECAAGLTCRLGPSLPEGRCAPYGSAIIGDACQMQADPDCGAQMDCFYLGPTVPQECRIICSIEDPQARCGDKACVPLWQQTIGYCGR